MCVRMYAYVYVCMYVCVRVCWYVQVPSIGGVGGAGRGAHVESRALRSECTSDYLANKPVSNILFACACIAGPEGGGSLRP